MKAASGFTVTALFFAVIAVANEYAHVPQSWVLAESYLPVHGALQGISWLIDGNTHTANPLELGPMSTPPTPLVRP
jgi:membrane-associated PAP2 superfamily phosphatase